MDSNSIRIGDSKIPVKVMELPAGWLFVLASPTGDSVAVLKDGSLVHFTVDPRTGQVEIKDSKHG